MRRSKPMGNECRERDHRCNQTMTSPAPPPSHCDVRIDEQLRRELGRHLCAIVDDYDQGEAAALLCLSQSAISALRRSDLRGGPSLSRLLRVIAQQRYSIDVHLKYAPRIQRSKSEPTLTVVRYDRFDRPIN